MIRQPTKKEIERLEEASQNDENNLSNLGLATHYIKGVGTFYYRLVCQFEKEVKEVSAE